MVLRAAAQEGRQQRRCQASKPADLLHVVEHIDWVAAVAAAAKAVKGAAVQQRLAAQHNVHAPAFLSNLQPVLQGRQRAVRPARPAVHRDVLPTTTTAIKLEALYQFCPADLIFE